MRVQGTLLALLATSPALAHERFVKNRLKTPLDETIFYQADGLFGFHPDMLLMAGRVFTIISMFLVLWYLRQPIEEFLRDKIGRPLGGRAQHLIHLISCFLSDRAVRSRLFTRGREWSTIFFMRSPAIVLIYSATNDALVMPSYPLDPASAEFFKFAQAGLAILILTQTALPLCGALIIGTWIHLFQWGWMVAIDAVPVLTVATAYLLSPWQSHKLATIQLDRTQIRWIRRILGMGFVVLGWLKLYNYNLTGGVAEHFPSVMDDPLIRLIMAGTDPLLTRETWVIAFGLSEVMSGFLLLVGVYSRIWSSIMVVVFTKLMLVDFGWDEIPHIFPISALLVILYSNRLTSDFDRLEAIEERLGWEGRGQAQAALIVASSVVVAFLTIFPILYLTTFLDRSSL